MKFISFIISISLVSIILVYYKEFDFGRVSKVKTAVAVTEIGRSHESNANKLVEASYKRFLYNYKLTFTYRDGITHIFECKASEQDVFLPDPGSCKKTETTYP